MRPQALIQKERQPLRESAGCQKEYRRWTHAGRSPHLAVLRRGPRALRPPSGVLPLSEPSVTQLYPSANGCQAPDEEEPPYSSTRVMSFGSFITW